MLSDTDSDAHVRDLGHRARAASAILKNAPTDAKNAALRVAARLVRDRMDAILRVNEAERARAADSLTAAQLDRLTLNAARCEAMATGLEAVADLPDPVGAILSERVAPRGFRIARMRVPLGVIGIIYESRPGVTLDAAALCVKSGNAAILRPGSDCFETSRVLTDLVQEALSAASLPADAAQMVPTADRAAVGAMLAMPDLIDVIVPRGGKSLTARVQRESRVPVLAHLDGNCHVYVDKDADPAMAEAIILNAKMRRTGICGAAETLLVDRAAGTLLTALVKALLETGCALRGDEAAQAADPRVTAATEEDWATEYLDAVLAVKIVEGIDDAIRHIERYGSHHTDAIVTANPETARRFMQGVDSAIVMHNASTQFADGGEFGMGAEIGIATGRLHARGPVGLEELTTYKNLVFGTGQVRP